MWLKKNSCSTIDLCFEYGFKDVLILFEQFFVNVM